MRHVGYGYSNFSTVFLDLKNFQLKKISYTFIPKNMMAEFPYIITIDTLPMHMAIAFAKQF